MNLWLQATAAAGDGPAGDPPLVFRTFMPAAAPSAFAVQWPHHAVVLSYDPLRGGVNQLWRGHIDLAPTVAAKINRPAAIEGRVLYGESLPQPLRPGDADAVPDRQFRGYHLDAGGHDRPGAVVFEFALDGVELRERLTIEADGNRLRRQFSRDQPQPPLWFRAEPQRAARLTIEGGVETAPGVWRFDGREFALLIDWDDVGAPPPPAPAPLPVRAATPHEARADAPHSYEIQEVALPPEMAPEISGVAFTPGGALVVVNRHGEVWLNANPPGPEWRRFAAGLHEPLGVLARSEREVWVTQRPELTRLRDTSGDGVADRYETVNEDWSVTDNWHEFTFGLRQTDGGDMVLSTGLPDLAGPINTLHPRHPLDLRNVHEERKPSPGRYLGWVLKVRPDGRMEPFASGFRAPAGVGLSPDGDIFITDQQGDYIATSTLVHVRSGRFYGHPASYKWHPDYRGPMTLEQLAGLRTPEAVALPHGSLGGSPGEPVWDTTGGGFGPFAGQVFIGDFTRLISRVALERIDGEYQGAAFPFIRDAVGLEDIKANRGSDNLTIPAGREGLRHFRDAPPRGGTPLRGGNMRMAFAADGSLYVGQTSRGWGQGDGLQRIVWSGRTPVEIESVQLTDTGFRLRFTTAMDRARLTDPDNWRVTRFRYLYMPPGSPRTDESSVVITDLEVAGDGREVRLVVDGLEPGFIHRFETERLLSADGELIENPLAYYTLNRTLDGRVFTGPMSEPLLADAATGASPGAPDIDDGRRVYAAFCVICHQVDGSGGHLPGAPELAAADLRTRGEDAPLARDDTELVRFITDGAEGKPMPPFGGVLRPQEVINVVAYLRAEFGEGAGAEEE